MIAVVITPCIPPTHSLLYLWLCAALIVTGKGWGQGRGVCVCVCVCVGGGVGVGAHVGFTDRLTFTVSSNV